jgi:hypothetical protein
MPTMTLRKLPPFVRNLWLVFVQFVLVRVKRLAVLVVNRFPSTHNNVNAQAFRPGSA